MQADPPAVLSSSAKENSKATQALESACTLLEECLPVEAREAVRRMRECIHFDVSGWLWQDDRLAHYTSLKLAILRDGFHFSLFTLLVVAPTSLTPPWNLTGSCGSRGIGIWSLPRRGIALGGTGYNASSA